MPRGNKIKAPIDFILKIVTLFFSACLITSYFTPYIDPADYTLLPFFGLAFPVLSLINIIILIVWLSKKDSWLWFPAIILILGIPFQMKIFSVSISKEDVPINASQWKVMSYNVHLFDLYNKDFKEALKTRNEIFEFIRKENPDVLCLQEYYEQKNPTRFNTLDSIKSIMGSDLYHEKGIHLKKSKQTFGVSIFSKYQIINQGDVVHQDVDKNNKNYCIYVDLVKESDTIRFYNVHLQSIKLEAKDYTNPSKQKNKDQARDGYSRGFQKIKTAFSIRAKQSEAVSKHIKTSPYPVIVSGDFNDTPMSYTYHKFEDDLTDAFRNTSSGFGATYIGILPAGRIDYIFHSKELNSSNFEIQKEELSDHRAISCIIY
ncbi:MAG: endonuclease/exonuclease/phosphatase family protein [Crocinitomicaceae bacterium]|tara:strand:+ start:23540 stop:24658 length:1119 start_codon:yes stop_codon:yes gene_type:complete